MARDETRKAGWDQIMKEPTPWEETCILTLEQHKCPLEGHSAAKETAPRHSSGSRAEAEFDPQRVRLWGLSPSSTTCLALGELLISLSFNFLLYKTGIMIMPIAWDHFED